MILSRALSVFAVMLAAIGAYLIHLDDAAGFWSFYAAAICGILSSFGGDYGDDDDFNTPTAS